MSILCRAVLVGGVLLGCMDLSSGLLSEVGNDGDSVPGNTDGGRSDDDLAAADPNGGDSVPGNTDGDHSDHDSMPGDTDGDHSDHDSTPGDTDGDHIPFQPFGTVTVSFDLSLKGTGSNIDSVAFWEAPDPQETILFVSSRADQLVQVWPFPFSAETDTLRPSVVSTDSEINGVLVDQATDQLYVTETEGTNRVLVYSLPDFLPTGVFGEGIVGEGENNLAMLNHANGERWVLVSDDLVIHAFNTDTYTVEMEFAPPTESMEELVADDHYQVIYVPVEQGDASSYGEGILAYQPDGTPYAPTGSNKFGTDVFEADEEGILLYTCPHGGGEDDGRGFIVVSDQRSSSNDFEVFDRQTWDHLGTFHVTRVEGTDGIASTQKALPEYPLGLFAAVDSDSSVKLVSWEVIIQATGLECGE